MASQNPKRPRAPTSGRGVGSSSQRPPISPQTPNPMMSEQPMYQSSQQPNYYNFQQPMYQQPGLQDPQPFGQQMQNPTYFPPPYTPSQSSMPTMSPMCSAPDSVDPAQSQQYFPEFETLNQNLPDDWLTEEEMAESGRKSGVWAHFLLNRSKDRAKCKTCGVKFSAKSSGGTGHLTRHMKKCGGAGADPTQPKLTQFNKTGLGSFVYSKDRDREELAKMIVKTEQPFTFSEHEAFHYYITVALQPSHDRVTRRQIKSTCMKLFLTHKQNLTKELQSLSCRISLTADSWDSGTSYIQYLCVTAHWIDDDWMVQKRILCLRLLEYPHTGLNIANCIMSVVDDYGIRDKIMSVTFDNASAMTACADLLKKSLNNLLVGGALLHVRCACHILNLCVKDGLKAIGPYFLKIKNIIGYINTSKYRFQEWKQLLSDLGLKKKKIPNDIDTRWNSTYEMLEVALEYKDAVTQFWNQRFPSNPVLEDDWKYVQCYMEFLNLFYTCTQMFSAAYTPTSNSFLNTLVAIASRFKMARDLHTNIYIDPETLEIEQEIEYNDPTFLQKLELKFKKYWSDVPLVFIFSSILDPRFKFDETIVFIESFMDFMNVEIDIEEFKRTVNDSFFILYNHYDSLFGKTNTPHAGSSSSSSGLAKIGKGILRVTKSAVSARQGNEHRTRTSSDMSEFQMFVNYDYMKNMSEDEHDSLDILAWWRHQQNHSPVLAAMARDLLSVQVSSVAAERVFSAAGRVLDPKRTSLKPETLEMLVCWKDWLDADTRTQGQSKLDQDWDSETGTTISGSSVSTLNDNI